MKKVLWILIILIIGVDCQESSQIDVQSILGRFKSFDTAEDFSHLELRDDRTFHFDQALSQSCEVWAHFYGDWEVIGNRIILYEGTNLDSVIDVLAKENLLSDTLSMVFDRAFLEEFPDLKVRIGLDSTDSEIQGNKIILDKSEYLKTNQIDEFASRNRESIYNYYPLELNMRAGGFYYIRPYILNYSEIRFALGTFKREYGEKRKLIEYQKDDGYLSAVACSYGIVKHKLKR